ncbi:LGC-26 protein [Aphelenchoides avenae]|nr:LGC-26 protein [Aphelenchus avenae]
MINVVLQGLFGWSMIKELPPGTGNMPKIVDLYALNLCLTGAVLLLHTTFHFLLNILPEDIELPYRLTDVTERLRTIRFFKVQGLSFDPQT